MKPRSKNAELASSQYARVGEVSVASCHPSQASAAPMPRLRGQEQCPVSRETCAPAMSQASDSKIRHVDGWRQLNDETR